MRKPAILSLLFAAVFILPLQAQGQNSGGPVSLSITETGAYSILERSNLRRYDNGRYFGHVLNEVRATIFPETPQHNRSGSRGNLYFGGNFYVMQNTIRDNRNAAMAVDKAVYVSFALSENGNITIEDDQGFPRMRNFPVFPNELVRPGAKWRASGSRADDPFNTGLPIIIPFIAEYEYRGIETYRDMQVHRIYAAYASRYQNDFPQENNFTRVQGGHRVDILIRADNGLLVFMQDNLNVTYTQTDGSTVRFEGFVLTFGQPIVPMDRAHVIASLENTFRSSGGAGLGTAPSSASSPRAAPSAPSAPPAPRTAPSSSPPASASPATAPSAAPSTAPSASTPSSSASTPPIVNVPSLQEANLDLTPVPEGIRLTVKDIHFAADSAEFLPEERNRLDLIAEALKQVPDRTFLVDGHTAEVGNPTGEMNLSIERAKRMADELVRRGIAADRFIYNGWGGTKPIADNSTAEGRARNRRVEITILE